MLTALPTLTDPERIDAEGFPIACGESSTGDRRLYLDVADTKRRDLLVAGADREITARLRSTLFIRLENRRRLEEIRRGVPLHYEFFETFDVVGARAIEVVLGAHLCRDQKGEGLYDENGKFVDLDQARRLAAADQKR